MFYAAFEHTINADRVDVAAEFYSRLKCTLTNSPGLRTSTSYVCPYEPTQHLTLATFSDQDTLDAWQVQFDHALVQQSSHKQVLDDYRIRVGPPVPLDKDISDCSMTTTTTTNRGRFLVIYEQPLSETTKPLEHQDIPILRGPCEEEAQGGENSEQLPSCIDVLKGLVDSAVYQSETSLVWLSAWPNRAAAAKFVGAIDRIEHDSVALVRVVRDYGLSDRKDALER